MNAYPPYQAYNPYYAAPPSTLMPLMTSMQPSTFIAPPTFIAPSTAVQPSMSTPAATAAVPCALCCALCCALVQSHRAIDTHWEFQVNAFMAWLANNGKSRPATGALPDDCELIFSLSTTIVYGRDCGSMEYAAVRTMVGNAVQYTFVHVPLNTGATNGFTNRCAFKNYNCPTHKLAFHLDLHRRG